MTDQYRTNNVLQREDAVAISSKHSGSNAGLSKVGSSAFNSRPKQGEPVQKFTLNQASDDEELRSPAIPHYSFADAKLEKRKFEFKITLNNRLAACCC